MSWGSIYYGFSLFVVPMERELGWDRATLNGALSLGLLAAGFGALPVGAWIDRQGGRAVMAAGSLLAAALFWLWGGVQSVAAFYLLWIGLGLSMSATLYEPVFAVLTRRFPHDFRLRIAMVTLVGGFASTVFIPLGQFLIDRLGWREALFVFAMVNLLVCLPVHLIGLNGDHRRGVDATPVKNAGALRRALRTRAFWGLMVAFVAYSASFSAITFHLVPLLTERGLPMALVVLAYSLIGPAQVAGRVVLLALNRHVSTMLAGQICFWLFPLSLLPLIWHGPFWSLVVFALVYGAANGVMTIVRGASVPDLMWREGYGAINGALAMPAMIAKAGAPLGAALLWQAASYDAVLWTVFTGGAIAAMGFRFAAINARN